MELVNANGCRARLYPLGASLLSLEVPDRNGDLIDIVLGYEDREDYTDNAFYLGCVVGRYAGRIARGEFRLEGECVQLSVNDGNNHIHGGHQGLSRKLWTIERASSSKVVFSCPSAEGDQGFPGSLYVEVSYTLDNRNALHIEYRASTNMTTVINLTNHSYFNLAGHGSGDVLDHRLQITSDRVAFLDEDHIPTGELVLVSGTPLDFGRAETIGAHIDCGDEQVRMASGYDHAWVLPGGEAQLTEAVVHVKSEDTGISLDLFTDQTSVQFYSGNHLPENWRGKGGTFYSRRQGLCLETQHLPNSPNEPRFPSTVLEPGETYRSVTTYSFRADSAVGVVAHRSRAQGSG